MIDAYEGVAGLLQQSSDDQADMQAYANRVGATGGGPVKLLPRLYRWNNLVMPPRTWLEGAGRDTSHNFTPGYANIDNVGSQSAVLSNGPDGSSMVSFAPSGADTMPGIGVRGVTFFSSLWPHTTAAGVAVDVTGGDHGTWDMMGVEFKTAVLKMRGRNADPVTNETNCHHHDIPYIGSRAYTNAGAALDFDGTPNKGNVCNINIGFLDAHHSSGPAARFGSCDLINIDDVRIERPSGSAPGLVFEDSDYADGPARNIKVGAERTLIAGPGGVLLKRNKAYPCYGIKLLNWNSDEQGSLAGPTLQGTTAGMTFYASNYRRAGAETVSAGIAVAQTVPDSTFTKVPFVASADWLGWFDSANHVFKPTWPGKYRISACVAINFAGGTIDQAGVQIRVVNEGSWQSYRALHTLSGVAEQSVMIDCVVDMDGKTDTLRVDVRQGTGTNASLETATDCTFFMASLVGPPT